MQLDANYLAQATNWDYDLHGSLRRQRNWAWLVAMVMVVFALLMAIAILLLLPLKEFRPYVISHDRSTGYVEVTQGVIPGQLSEQEAIRRADIARFILAWENYDYRDTQRQYDYLILNTRGPARAAYLDWVNDERAGTNSNRLGRAGIITATLKAISFPNDDTAFVRFRTLTRTRAGEVAEHWQGVVQFRYANLDLSLAQRLNNPLGFQVESYRRDQETVKK